MWISPKCWRKMLIIDPSIHLHCLQTLLWLRAGLFHPWGRCTRGPGLFPTQCIWKELVRMISKFLCNQLYITTSPWSKPSRQSAGIACSSPPWTSLYCDSGTAFKSLRPLVALVTPAPNPAHFLPTTPVNAAFYYGNGQTYLLMKIYLKR